MLRDIGDDASERAQAKIVVVGDRDVVLAIPLRRESHVTACFARDRVPVAAQRTRQIAAGEIAWEADHAR
jgi:hypothetical protein